MQSKICLTCKENLIEYHDTININNINIKLNSNTTCSSTYVIYSIFCTNCEIFYIGKAQTMLKQRVNLHRHHLKCQLSSTTLPITRHLKECSINNFKITIIHQLTDKKPLKLTFAENYFIKLLTPPLNC
jgi:hypothetical protein